MGPTRRLRETTAAVGFAFALALVAIYMILASQFNSFVHPFTIMLSAPLSFLGAFAAIRALGHSLDVMGQIAFLMLMGIVMKNGILLVDYTNTLRRRDKMGIRQAIELAGRHRLRPILMTSMCTSLGLVPMALGIGEGAELQAPLARVVIGGLITSTIITLVFVPAVYTLFEEGWRGIFKKGGAAPAESAAH
jgi:HAE1 family hydrophobic/amphiphilic exporter-1